MEDQSQPGKNWDLVVWGLYIDFTVSHSKMSEWSSSMLPPLLRGIIMSQMNSEKKKKCCRRFNSLPWKGTISRHHSPDQDQQHAGDVDVLSQQWDANYLSRFMVSARFIIIFGGIAANVGQVIKDVTERCAR